MEDKSICCRSATSICGKSVFAEHFRKLCSRISHFFKFKAYEEYKTEVDDEVETESPKYHEGRSKRLENDIQ